MFGPAANVAVDLRGAGLRLATREMGTVRCWSVPAAATWRDGAVVLGQEAADLLREEPGAGWDRLTLRIGDAVPVLLGGTAHSATELVARILTGALPSTTDRVILVTPPRWSPAVLQEFIDALATAGAPSVEVAEHAAVLAALSAGEPAGGVLVINLGPEASTATLLDAPQGRTIGQFPFQLTTDDFVDHTTEIARREAETAAGRRLTDSEARGLAAGCEAAPVLLPRAQRLDVQLPGLSAVRISRAQLDRPVARVANSAAEGLLTALEAQGAALPRSVLVEGCGPSSPIISALSVTFGEAVSSAPEAAVAVLKPLAASGAAVASGDEPHDAWAFPVPPPANRPPLAAPAQEPPIAPMPLLVTASPLSAANAPIATPAVAVAADLGAVLLSESPPPAAHPPIEAPETQEPHSAPEALPFSEPQHPATHALFAASAVQPASTPEPIPYTDSPPARPEADPGSLRRRGAAAAVAVLALAAVGVGAGPAMTASLRANSSAGNATVALAQPAESPSVSRPAAQTATPMASPGPSASPTHTPSPSPTVSTTHAAATTEATTKVTTKAPVRMTPPVQAATTTTTTTAAAPATSTTAPAPPATTATP